MGKFTKKPKKGVGNINTASLPDIVFMLLFFFMVVTTLKDKDPKVKIRLPSHFSIKIDPPVCLQTSRKMKFIHMFQCFHVLPDLWNVGLIPFVPRSRPRERKTTAVRLPVPFFPPITFYSYTRDPYFLQPCLRP